MAEIAEVRSNHNGSVTQRNHHQGYHTLPAAARGNVASRGNTNNNVNHGRLEEGPSNEEYTGESGTIAPMPSPILPTLTAHKAGPLLRPGSMVELRSGIRLEKIKKPRERERDRHNNHHDTLSKWASQDSLHHRLLLLFVHYILIHMVLDILPAVMNSCLIGLGLHTLYGLYRLNPLTLGSGPHFTQGW